MNEADPVMMFGDNITTMATVVDTTKTSSFHNINNINNSSSNNRNNNRQISLFDIFPAHIAQSLQEGRPVVTERKECVILLALQN